MRLGNPLRFWFEDSPARTAFNPTHVAIQLLQESGTRPCGQFPVSTPIGWTAHKFVAATDARKNKASGDPIHDGLIVMSGVRSLGDPLFGYFPVHTAFTHSCP